MNIRLTLMSKDLCRGFLREFENDPAVFAPDQLFYEYRYSEEKADAYWERNQVEDRVHLAIMMDHELIGELLFKKIDPENRHCTLSIHMKNDSVKNQGYGTEAERQALIYARENINMETVFADTLIQNKRSQRVLEKNGFRLIESDDVFRYYQRIL